MWELLVADFKVMSRGGHFSFVFVVFFNFPVPFPISFVLEYLLDIINTFSCNTAFLSVVGEKTEPRGIRF